MNITIEIKAPELAKAIEVLAAALSGSGLTNVAPVQAAATKEEKQQEKPKAEKQQPKKEEAPQPDPQPEEKTETANISLEVVRTKLAELSQNGKQKEVKALITSFGVKKLTDIPKEQYAEVLEKAGEIA